MNRIQASMTPITLILRTSLMRLEQLLTIKVSMYLKIFKNCITKIKNKYIFLLLLQRKMKRKLPINHAHIAGTHLK